MNKEYSYVYAIVRVDEYKGPNCPIERKVIVKEIVHDEDAANREVARLNALQRPNESRYFSQVTRLLPKAASDPTPEAAPVSCRIEIENEAWGRVLAQKRVLLEGATAVNTVTSILMSGSFHRKYRVVVPKRDAEVYEESYAEIG